MRRIVLVFNDPACEVDAHAALADCHKRVSRVRPIPDADAALAALIDLGIVEAAIADVLCPLRDTVLPVLVQLRRAMDALARGDSALAGAALDRVSPDDVPRRIRLSVPEGFAYYALYPSAYAAAVTEWATDSRPGSVVCLGLRSIGTTLASVCAAALAPFGIPVVTWTLRPRGHPFDRQVCIDPELTASWQPASATFVILDEGPGLSGSSLTGAAAAIRDLGVPDNRIVIAAAWNPEPATLRLAAARATWRRHRVLTAGFTRVRAAAVPTDAVDISGRWREYFQAAAPWPAVHPQHERVKFILNEGAQVARFAGLGDAGVSTYQRAARLADGGWCAEPARLQHGFLTQPVIGGRPMTRRDVGARFLTHAADYLAWLRRHESGTDSADVDALTRMLRINAAEAFGDTVTPAIDRLVTDLGRTAEPATRIDGRLAPHEWLITPAGFAKTDALDHHRDHFFPGATDVAWDVAGLIVETGVAAGEAERVLERYVAGSGDRFIARRLPFHLAAYLAFRLGYCTMAMESLGGEEQQRFRAERDRYARGLRRALIPNAV
jgi:hypothetical protein